MSEIGSVECAIDLSRPWGWDGAGSCQGSGGYALELFRSEVPAARGSGVSRRTHGVSVSSASSAPRSWGEKKEALRHAREAVRLGEAAILNVRSLRNQPHLFRDKASRSDANCSLLYAHFYPDLCLSPTSDSL